MDWALDSVWTHEVRIMPFFFHVAYVSEFGALNVTKHQ